MSVHAVTPTVPAGHGLRFWPPSEPRDSDALNHDAANDELVSAAHFDELALTPARPSRNRFRPSLADSIREVLAFPAGRADRAIATTPAASGCLAARGPSPSKENHE